MREDRSRISQFTPAQGWAFPWFPLCFVLSPHFIWFGRAYCSHQLATMSIPTPAQYVTGASFTTELSIRGSIFGRTTFGNTNGVERAAHAPFSVNKIKRGPLPPNNRATHSTGTAQYGCDSFLIVSQLQ
jgi:hypothetical protein